jgi:hypothetical protein
MKKNVPRTDKIPVPITLCIADFVLVFYVKKQQWINCEFLINIVAYLAK